MVSFCISPRPRWLSGAKLVVELLAPMSVSHLRTQGPRGQEVLQRSTLQGIAAQSGPGAAQAQAWLRMLEQPTPEVVELPTKAKRLQL